MDLNEIAIFLKVVQSGSFTQAAKALGLPNSTVSSKVSTLEKRLGITLIQRTTRKLNITPAGLKYYQRCLSGLAEIQAAEAEVSSLKGAPSGMLRLTAPADLGRSLLPDIITRFTKEYPAVVVEVILTDRRVDLLSEGVDLAIRAGVLKDSTLVAKKLGTVYFVPVASPKYLRHSRAPGHPRELKEHKTICFTPLGIDDWRLVSPKGGLLATIIPRVIINDLDATYSMVMAGEGIAMVPSYMCYKDIHSGKLIRVLPEWKSAVNPVHFVYPAQRFVSPKLQAFMKFAGEDIRKVFIDMEV